MSPSPLAPQFIPSDPVADAIQENVRSLEQDGHGEFSAAGRPGAVVLRFGELEVEGENYDIALMKLAGTMLEDGELCGLFLQRIERSKFIAHWAQQSFSGQS